MKACYAIILLLASVAVAADGPDGTRLEALDMELELPATSRWTSTIKNIGEIPDDLLSRTDADGRRQDIWISGFPGSGRTCDGWAEFVLSEGGSDTRLNTDLRPAGWHEQVFDIQNGRSTIACLDIRDGTIGVQFAGPAFETPPEHRTELITVLEALRRAAPTRFRQASSD